MSDPLRIPYEDIDAEIRPLIELMNKIPGLTTLFSCIGHEEDEEGYVLFEVESQAALKSLMSCLEQKGKASVCFTEGMENFRWNRALVSVNLYDERIRYRLSLRGSPLFMQRQLIGDIEKRLRKGTTTTGAHV